MGVQYEKTVVTQFDRNTLYSSKIISRLMFSYNQISPTNINMTQLIDSSEALDIFFGRSNFQFVIISRGWCIIVHGTHRLHANNYALVQRDVVCSLHQSEAYTQRMFSIKYDQMSLAYCVIQP